MEVPPGVDERAQQKLATLSEEAQQEIIGRLIEGQANGSINNPSGFVVAASIKAAVKAQQMGEGARLEDLGVDPKAASLLGALPSHDQALIISQLEQAKPANPSAWVAKAALNAGAKKQQEFMPMMQPMMQQMTQPMFGGGKAAVRGPPQVAVSPDLSGSFTALGVDVQTAALVRNIPLSAQMELLMQLQQAAAAGQLRNPSAWVAKAVNNAGVNVGGMGGGTLMGSVGGGMCGGMGGGMGGGMCGGIGGGMLGGMSRGLTQPIVGNDQVLSPEMLGVDARASESLRSLAPAMQQQLLIELKEGLAESRVQNPSGWLVKAINKVKSQPGSGMVQQQQLQQQQFGGSFAQSPQILGLEPSQSPQSLGVDARACELLSGLPSDMQQQLLIELKEGLAESRVTNPSGWLVKAINKLKAQAGGVIFDSTQNPDMPKPPVFLTPNGEPLTPEVLGVDERAAAMLRTLALGAQQELLRQLSECLMEGRVQNPSGWVVKAITKSGQKSQSQQMLPPQYQTAGGAMESPLGFEMHNALPPQTPSAETLTPEMLGVDERATEMVKTLPLGAQQELLRQLNECLIEGRVQNPSGWVVKAITKSGNKLGSLSMTPPSYATGGPVPNPVQMGVDVKAQEMLQSLPHPQQREILHLLQQGLSNGSINNPSGYVVKKCQTARSMGGGVRFTPY